MKKSYEGFKANGRDSESVYQSLSKKNKDALEKFDRESLITSKSKTRQGNRRRTIIRFLDFMQKDFDKLDYNDYVALASAISNSKLDTYARNSEKDFIKRFLKANYDDWNIRFKGFKLLKYEQKSEKEKLTAKDLITADEVERMIKATTNMRYKTLISLLWESAGRPEEVLKVRWCDIDFKKRLIYLYSIKTKRKRAVPLDAALSHLKRLYNEGDYSDNDLIFHSFDKTKQLSNSALNLIIKQLGEKANIKKNVFPYAFRHSRLSLLIVKLSPKTYEEISGHSLEMGMRCYAHLSQDQLIKEMNEKVFEVEELSEVEKTENESLKGAIELLINLELDKTTSKKKENLLLQAIKTKIPNFKRKKTTTTEWNL